MRGPRTKSYNIKAEPVTRADSTVLLLGSLFALCQTASDGDADGCHRGSAAASCACPCGACAPPVECVLPCLTVSHTTGSQSDPSNSRNVHALTSVRAGRPSRPRVGTSGRRTLLGRSSASAGRAGAADSPTHGRRSPCRSLIPSTGPCYEIRVMRVPAPTSPLHDMFAVCRR